MNPKTNLKIRLIVMNFLIFAVWGAYLCSLGIYLGRVGMGAKIGQFFAIQGVISLLMPTIALGNSVSYNALTKAGLDTVKAFPPIRVFGTIGFILSMWIVNFTGFKNDHNQLFVSAAWGLILAAYAFTLPNCPVSRGKKSSSLVDAFGLRAFTLFKDSKMCVFFIFSFLLGMCLQVTNGFATPYLDAFGQLPEYANAFAVKNNVFLSSISQVSETLCILLIPFCLKRFGIKKVMLISFFAWFLRFAFLGAGNPTGWGLVLFILSMIVYGVAFDFFNISGSLFVDQNTDESIRSSAQGVFMMMTNGLGATIGSLCAQMVVNHFTMGKTGAELMTGWTSAWYVFAGFALVLAFLFAALFKYKHNPAK